MASRERLSRPPRVLIGSDQDAGLRDVENFLGQHGYFVFRVYAGAAVLERARAARPDVIVVDARLGDRDSLVVCRTLRDDPLIGVSTPILLLVTGRSTPQDHLAALRAGVWEFLPLPLNSNDLLRKLDTYVRAKVEADRAPEGNLVDAVTGLYTAQGLARRATELIFQASQHNTAAACVIFAPEFQMAAGDPSRSLNELGPTWHRFSGQPGATPMRSAESD